MRNSNLSLIVAMTALTMTGFALMGQADATVAVDATPGADTIDVASPAGPITADDGAFTPIEPLGELSPPTTSVAFTTTVIAEPVITEPIVIDPALTSSTTTTLDTVLSPAERRGVEALQSIDFPWKTLLPGWTIEFHDALDGAYGYTLTQEHRIEIYVRDSQSDELLAHVIAHELGHALDVTLNDGDDRRRWLEARAITDSPWWPDNKASDFATGAGDLAESFAAWQVGADSFRSELAGPPTDAQIDLLAELLSN